MEYAVIDSEQGGTLTMVNPWGNAGAVVCRCGRMARDGEAAGERITLAMEKGERLFLLPPGDWE
ncbi:hypothetical protein D3C81_2009750 [compost metagenome]